MESFSRDNEESTEDITKRKSFKIKSIKTRFFRRSKKTGSEADAKLSQSASDINTGKGLGSVEDLASQGTMGSRAFSHDSIFLADEVLSDPDPVRVSSQENVHSKIKSLQMKLQLQKMHFGPPPMVLPIRSPEETAHQSEDFPFHGSNETSREETLTKTTSQPTSPPFSPISRLAQTRSQPQMTSFHFSLSGPNYSSPNIEEAPVDFSTPAEFTASLDTSAARHRMSIKPRNQRASTKKKAEIAAQEREAEETEKEQVNISQLSPPKLEEASPVSSDVAPKLPSQSFTQQDNALPETEVFPVLRVKPLRHLDAFPSKRPHSSYIESEIKEKKEADLESQVTSQNKRNTFVGSMIEVSPDQLSPFSLLMASRASAAQLQKLQRDEDTSTRIKRPSPGSGSFHFSRNWDEERPRSGSFTGVLEKSKARTKTFEGTEEKLPSEIVEDKSFTGVLESSEAKTRSFGGTEEKITREKWKLKDFPEVLEKTETKTKSFGEVKEKITREKVELKGFPEVLEKTETKTKSFGEAKEKITTQNEELKPFPEVLEKTEAKTKLFGGTDEKITREKKELKGFPEVQEKTELWTRSSGGIEEKITREKKELKGFPEVQEKTETKTRLFGGTKEKITKEREGLKGFPDVLEKIETKTGSFGGTEEKPSRENLEHKSFTGFLESPEAKTRASGGTEERFTREKEELKSLQPKGSHCAADRSKGSSFSWERNASFKKSESGITAKNAPTDTYIVEAVGVDGTQELVEEAQEAKELPEDEMRTPFGIKLRTTSQSFKFRSETASHRHSMTRLSNDQDDKKKRRLGDGSSQMSESILANMSSSLKSSDQAPFGVTLPVRRHTSLEESPQTTPTEVQKTSANPREAETTPSDTQTSPQTSSSEVSWMSVAMEKTRSLQQLLTSRFQRDFTGTQTTAQPKSLEETMTGSQVQVQAVKIQQSTTQPSSDIVKEESVQSNSQEEAVKPLTAATQKKMMQSSQIESNSPRHSKIFRQRSQSQTQPNRAQSDAQTIPRTTHPPSPSSPPIGNTSPFTKGYAPQLVPQSHPSSVQQQTPWTSRGFQPVTQLKHVPPALESEPEVTAAVVPTLESAQERREREVSVPKESPSLVSKRVLWTGSMADRAAFMEKRAEWSTLPSLKEVEQRKAQTQIQISGDADTSVKLFPLSKETMEIKQVVKSAESSPSRVIEKPREDKWTQRNVELPSSPSSLRTHSSVLQSDSNQPSWMELAKRKSMAWSDKTMD